MPGYPIVGRVAIKVIPDTSGFREDVKTDLNGREKPDDIKVRVIPDIDQKDLDAVKGKLEEWAKRISPLKISVAPNLETVRKDVIAAELDVLARDRRVKIIPDLSQSGLAKVATALGALSGLRATLGMFHDFREELLNLDQAVPKIGLVSHAIAGLAALALAGAGNFFSLGNSIAEIGLAGLALPGILGGIAIGLGASLIALKDFKKYVPQITADWKTLESAISTNFWAQAQGPISNLVDNLFPKLTQMAKGTGTALGNFFGNLANSLNGKLLPDLGPMFDNLNKSIDIFSKHTDGIANSIAVLGSVGSQYLPQLAAWIGQIVDQFSKWLTASQQSGKLTGWIDQGVSQIKLLFSGLTSIVSIFHSLGEAAQAAGGTTLQTLAGTLGAVAKAAASPGFQSGLTGVLTTAYNMMQRISGDAGPALQSLVQSLADTFNKLGPTLGDTFGTALSAIANALASPAIQQGLQAMFQGFNQMVNGLAPAMQPLADKFGALMQVVGALASNIGFTLGAALEAVSPMFVAIATALVPVINMLGPMLTSIINALAPVFQVLGTQIANVVTAIQPLLTALMSLWNTISPVLIPVLQIAAQLLGQTLVMAINGITDVINGVVAVIQGFVQFFSGMVDFIKGYWEIIVGLFTLNGDLISKGWSDMWTGIQNMLSGFIQILGGLLQAIWGAVQTYIALGVVKLFTGAFDAIIAFGRSFGDTLKSVLTVLWDSIKSRASLLWNQIEVMPSIAFDAIIAFFKGAVGDVKAAIELIWEALPSGLTKVISNIKSTITGIPGSITGWIGDTGSLLLNAGKAVIQGFIDGIKGMFDSVKSTLGDLTSKLTSWKGPEPLDRVILTGAGVLVIQGFINGLESQYDAVKRSLAGLTDDVAKQAGLGAQDISSALTDGLTGVGVSGSLGNLSTKITAATKEAGATQNADGSISIGNITIPLEDLAQLQDLNEFMDLLRVRTRQGTAA